MTYETATFFDCRGDETLRWETVEDCLEDLVATLIFPQGKIREVEDVIRSYGPVTVRGYVHAEVSEVWLRRQAEALAEALAESFAEEFGDPEDDSRCDIIAEAGVDDLLSGVRAAVARTQVWACEDAGSRTYSVDEVLTMLREHRPDWFEEGKP